MSKLMACSRGAFARTAGVCETMMRLAIRNAMRPRLQCLPGLLGAALLSLTGTTFAQQSYPNKPIRFITPYAAGGTTSILGRNLGQKMTEAWGQPVVMDNRPGGGTIIGTEALAKAPPDGYTIMLMASTHVIIPLLTKVPFDPVADFAPVTTLATSEYLLTLHPSVPANSVQEFIALVKSRPGQFNSGIVGSGGTQHLVGEMFKLMTGVNFQSVPYKGGGPVITDLVGGQIQLTFIPPLAVLPHIKAGRLKGLAISGENRLTALPQVPTFTEAGLPNYDVKAWYGVLAPAGTPKPIIDKLAAEFARIIPLPDIRKSLDAQGLEPFVLNPQQFSALLAADTNKFAKVIKAVNIKLEN